MPVLFMMYLYKLEVYQMLYNNIVIKPINVKYGKQEKNYKTSPVYFRVVWNKTQTNSVRERFKILFHTKFHLYIYFRDSDRLPRFSVGLAWPKVYSWKFKNLGE